MLIDLSEILSTEGLTKSVEVHVDFDSFQFKGMDYRVGQADDFQLNLSNDGKNRVKVTGSTDVVMELVCDRCLEDVEVKVILDFKHKIDTESDAYDQSEDLDENNYIDGYSLDVEQLVYNELLVGWPTKILCSEDCKGICNVCGQNLNKGTCNCEDTGLDPRMSVIRDVFKNFKEV